MTETVWESDSGAGQELLHELELAAQHRDREATRTVSPRSHLLFRCCGEVYGILVGEPAALSIRLKNKLALPRYSG